MVDQTSKIAVPGGGHMTRHHAAVVLQRHARGAIARKETDLGLNLRNNKLAVVLMHCVLGKGVRVRALHLAAP